MAKEKKKSLKGAVSSALKKKFDLSNFKDKKGLSSNTKFKPQEWLPLSEAFKDVLSIPGVPLGQITLLRGHSDTGKTSALIEAAVSAQSRGILPVLIITEMKWNWEHVIKMGFEVTPVLDKKGEIQEYEGEFIYVDREALHSVEDVAGFIIDLLDEQKKGNLPYDLLFLWDSVGSIPCELSIRSKKNNNEWNASAMATQFGNSVNQQIVLSRKESSPYTNTLVCTNKTWTQKPEHPMGKPRMMNKGGFAMWFDAALVVTFGNILTAGTSKIKAVKGGKQVEFAKRVNVQIDKNHINGITTRGKIVMTSHGFIEDSKKALDNYKDEYTDEWSIILGGGDFNIIEEEEGEIDGGISNGITQHIKEPE